MVTINISDKKLIPYQYRMCLYGEPEGLVPFSLIEEDETFRIIIRDWHYFGESHESHRLDSAMVNKLFSLLALVMDACNEYLLDLNKVVFELERVLVNDQGEMALIYMPFEKEQALSDREALAAFVHQIRRRSDAFSESLMAVFHRMDIALEDENFKRIKFQEFLLEQIGGLS